MKSEILFETDRLLVIPIKIEHAEKLHGFWSDPLVTEYMNITPLTSLEQTEQMIGFLLNLMAIEEATRYTIMIKDTQEIIGTCGLNYIDQENNRTEIAYDLGSLYWGQGYAFEALSAFMEWALKNYRFHRVEAKIDPRNTGSIRLIEKLNFQKEGLLRDYEKIGDTYTDLLMYSYLAK